MEIELDDYWGDASEPEISTYFVDESQEIVMEYDYKTDNIEVNREKIECPVEYFKRKLLGE